MLIAALVGIGSAPAAAVPRARGGTSFEDAPLLKPGRFVDEIAAGETLFYAVQVEERQRLSVGLEVHPGGRAPRVAARLRVYNRDRIEDVFAHEPKVVGPGPSTALRTAGGIVVISPDYPRPGIQYFSIATEFIGRRIAGSYALRIRVGVE
ncbi:MAG: hypothetical protein ACRDJ5_10800, partial [Actinomycetota bacterium]